MNRLDEIVDGIHRNAAERQAKYGARESGMDYLVLVRIDGKETGPYGRYEVMDRREWRLRNDIEHLQPLIAPFEKLYLVHPDGTVDFF